MSAAVFSIDNSIDSSFQFRLSSFLTKSFTGEINDSSTALSNVIERYSGQVSGQPQIGGLTSPAGPKFISPLALADSLTTQQTANRRLRLAALAPLTDYLKSFTANNLGKRPRLAELARSQRFKRALDVHSDTMKIEDEIIKVWSIERDEDQLKQFGRRRAVEIIQRATQTLCEQSQLYSLESPPKQDTVTSERSSHSDSVHPVAPSGEDGHRLEQTIYYCHEAIERILRTLLDLGSTLQVGSQDDNLIMMEFDAIGKRRSESTSSSTSSSSTGYVSPAKKDPPTLLNYTVAIALLLAALPPKYNIDVLKALISLDSVGAIE